MDQLKMRYFLQHITKIHYQPTNNNYCRRKMFHIMNVLDFPGDNSCLYENVCSAVEFGELKRAQDARLKFKRVHYF